MVIWIHMDWLVGWWTFLGEWVESGVPHVYFEGLESAWWWSH